MNIGEKLRQARLEAGLSQRQLCGDIITRNMLSQIENGSARPSMDTLGQLAAVLGKPMSFFLEETAVASANVTWMAQARDAFSQGNFARVAEILRAYRGPDPVFDQEKGLLELLSTLSLAETAAAENRHALARKLLERAGEVTTCYATPEIQQRLLLLRAQVSGEAAPLPADDRPLLIRAENALKEKNCIRCRELLAACENRDTPRWHYLMAEAELLAEHYPAAAEHYGKAEKSFPRECYPKLEICYRNLGDYKLAYEYACKQR